MNFWGAVEDILGVSYHHRAASDLGKSGGAWAWISPKVQRPLLRPGTVEHGFLWEDLTGPLCNEWSSTTFLCSHCSPSSVLAPLVFCKFNTRIIAVRSKLIFMYQRRPISWWGNYVESLLIMWCRSWRAKQKSSKKIIRYQRLKGRGSLKEDIEHGCIYR